MEAVAAAASPVAGVDVAVALCGMAGWRSSAACGVAGAAAAAAAAAVASGMDSGWLVVEGILAWADEVSGFELTRVRRLRFWAAGAVGLRAAAACEEGVVVEEGV